MVIDSRDYDDDDDAGCVNIWDDGKLAAMLSNFLFGKYDAHKDD